MIPRADVTGLILAGGQGSRMGGADKGLQSYWGEPLAAHVLRRLSPQVREVMISANRNFDAYKQLGAPVWPDAEQATEHMGPLAGFLAGLQHCETPYLLTAPCDCPHLPTDLAECLGLALTAANADVAIAATQHNGQLALEPAFCLIKQSLEPSLLQYLQSGERKIERWTALHRRVEVVFENAEEFFNINTAADLSRLEATCAPPR